MSGEPSSIISKICLWNRKPGTMPGALLAEMGRGSPPPGPGRGNKTSVHGGPKLSEYAQAKESAHIPDDQAKPGTMPGALLAEMDREQGRRSDLTSVHGGPKLSEYAQAKESAHISDDQAKPGTVAGLVRFGP